MADDPHYLVQGQKGVAPNLRGNILALGAEGEELDEIEVVGQVSRGVSLLGSHELQQCAKRQVIVEHQDIITRIGQLVGQTMKRDTHVKWMSYYYTTRETFLTLHR